MVPFITSICGHCCLLLDWKSCLYTHSPYSVDSGSKVQVSGFGCLKPSLLGAEQAVGETAGSQHNSVCLNLTRSRFCLSGCRSNCFLHKAVVAPGTGGGFTELSLKYLNVTSAIGLLVSLTAEG